MSYAMLCNAMVHVWYNEWDYMRLYAIVWDSNDIVWDSNAMIWDLNAMPCYGVCFKRYACKLKKKVLNISKVEMYHLRRFTWILTKLALYCEAKRIQVVISASFTASTSSPPHVHKRATQLV